MSSFFFIFMAGFVVFDIGVVAVLFWYVNRRRENPDDAE
jgi:hypothetical protein